MNNNTQNETKYWVDPVYYYGDFSQPKWALYKKFIDEDGDEVEERVMWGFCEDLPGYYDEDPDPEEFTRGIDALIEEELGFLPDYVIG